MSGILQGWKEIAAYLSRDERTVKRWEKQRGLPVRRMPGSGRANVYAMSAELDSWLSSTPATEAGLEAEPEIPSDADRNQNSPASDDPDSEVSLNASLAASSESTSDPALDRVVEPGFAVDATPDSNLLLKTRSAVSSEADRRAVGTARNRVWTGAERRRRKLSLRWGAAALSAGLILLAALAVFAWRRDRRPKPVMAASEASTRAGQLGTRVVASSPVAGVDELYLRGVFSYEKRTPESLRHALQCFQQAVDKDPKYAPAYAGLANTYNLLREYSASPSADVFIKARAAAEKAIALDPSLPQAHAALGFALFFGFWQPGPAEHEFQTAIALDPNASLPHSWYGSILTHEARYKEALEQLDIAYRLQPSSAAIACSRAFTLGLSGRRDEGADLLQEMINEDRDVTSAHLRLGILSLVEPREIPRYLDAERRRAEINQDADRLTELALEEKAFRKDGEPGMWKALLAEEQRRHPGETTWSAVSAEAALGKTGDALTHLETLVKQREPNLMGIEINPLMAGMRSDPRFQQIVREVGLQPAR